MKNSRLKMKSSRFDSQILIMFSLVQPNFFSKNHLLLGKTFLRGNKKEEAKVWLEKAVNSNPSVTVDDEMVRTLSNSIRIEMVAPVVKAIS